MRKAGKEVFVGIEGLEGRRLMTGMGMWYDPIVGPVGTTPGTIGGFTNTPGDSSGYYVGNGNSATHGFGNRTGVIVAGSSDNVVGKTLGNPGSDWDATLFYRKGFPLLFSDGAKLQMKGATLTITGTRGDDTILISRPLDRFGRAIGFDITVNDETRRFDPNFSRFVQVISVDAGRGDDLVAEDEDMAIRMSVRGGDGNDSLAGGAGNDTLSGGNGNDVLIGGAGKDVLNGDNGNDTLSGGLGVDKINGGKGKDTGDGDEDDVIKGVEK